MATTNFASASKPRKMTNTDGSHPDTVGSIEYSRKQVMFTIFYEPTKRVGTEISNLHHPRQFAVYKERRFDDAFYVPPKCSLPMEMPH